MKIVVLKFGGTSVGTIKKIKNVVEIIKEYKKKKYNVIVVSSAMSGVTNDLIKKSKEISQNFPDTEYDVLVSSGEQVACSLIAGRLINDGFKLPSNFDYKELSKKYNIPNNLLKLIDNNQNAFLALKIVEIIGEDEPYQLDSETVYFITNLLNKMNLRKIRNIVFNSALPLRA